MKTFRFTFPILLILLLTLSCNLPTTKNPLTAYQDGLVQGYIPQVDPDTIPEENLSEHQETILQTYGYPQRFIIHFDSQGQRSETWYYDQSGLNLTFENGVEINRIETQPLVLDGLGTTLFHPDQFTTSTTLDHILALNGETGFTLETINNDAMKNGKLIFMKGLSLGFVENKLRYIETLPFGTQEGQIEINNDQFQPTAIPLPSSEKIIFYSETEGGTYDIFSINPDGANRVSLTNHSGNDLDAACNADGTQIVFISDRSGIEQIYLTDSSGGQIQQLTDETEFGPSSLKWLDPYTVLFWNGFGNLGFYTLDIETFDLTPQTEQYGDSVYSDPLLPSPDKSLFLENRYNPEAEIFQIFLHEGDQVNLLHADDGFTYLYPIWSPDGQEIIYSSNQSGNFEIYIVDRSGNLVRQLTNNPGRDIVSCWLP